MHQFLVTIPDEALNGITLQSVDRNFVKDGMAEALKAAAGLDCYAEIYIDHLGMPINPDQLPESPESDTAQSSTG